VIAPLVLSLLAVQGSLPAPVVELAGGTLVLPAGPVADAAAELGPDTVPADLGPPPPADPAARWGQWASLLDAERGSPTSAGRARLARLAAADGRTLDAWGHLASCEPADLAAVLPSLLPGAPKGHPVRAGGAPAPLPDGALLRPGLPPQLPGLPAGAIGRRSMRLESFELGGARLSMLVRVEADGVRVELAHLEGPEVRVRVVIPRPPLADVRVEYADWERVEGKGVPREVVLVPGGEEGVLWSRFVQRPAAWPGEVPERLPTALAEGGLVVLHGGDDDPERANLAALAAALGSLFGVPASAGGEPPPREGPGAAPLAIDLRPADGRRAKRAALVSLAERLALREPVAPGER
jgi:hypothetical protein